MKKIFTISFCLSAVVWCGCSADSTSNAANNGAYVATNAMSANVSAATNGDAPPVGSVSTGNYAADGEREITAEDHLKDKDRYSNKSAGNVAAPGSTNAESGARTIEKKDEGLFAFPPPKAIDVYEIPLEDLATAGGAKDFAAISRRLSDALKNADHGYSDNFYYFWNNDAEFAIVTKMERVSADGTPLAGSERWLNTKVMPTAIDLPTYFEYLFYGKTVYYRVLSFVVSAKRKRSAFTRGATADFATASSWGDKGESRLGDGDGTSDIELTEVTGKFYVFALLYLFVNHTSLDEPKALNAEDPHVEMLKANVNQEIEDHLKNTGIKIGAAK